MILVNLQKKSIFLMSKENINLNVASSIYVIKDFVNLENSIYLKYHFVFRFIKSLLPRKYAEKVEAYSAARKKAVMLVHDKVTPPAFHLVSRKCPCIPGQKEILNR